MINLKTITVDYLAAYNNLDIYLQSLSCCYDLKSVRIELYENKKDSSNWVSVNYNISDLGWLVNLFPNAQYKQYYNQVDDLKRFDVLDINGSPYLVIVINNRWDKSQFSLNTLDPISKSYIEGKERFVMAQDGGVLYSNYLIQKDLFDKVIIESQRYLRSFLTLKGLDKYLYDGIKFTFVDEHFQEFRVVREIYVINDEFKEWIQNGFGIDINCKIVYGKVFARQSYLLHDPERVMFSIYGYSNDGSNESLLFLIELPQDKSFEDICAVIKKVN